MKKSKIFISCEEAYQICDKAQYNEATLWEKFKLNIRYSWCKYTKSYVAKNKKLSNTLNSSNIDFLKTEEKKRIQQQFDNQLQNKGYY